MKSAGRAWKMPEGIPRHQFIMSSGSIKATWHAVTKIQFAAFSAGLVLFGFVLLKCESGCVPLLDGANLLFHEAGHIGFGLFGPVAGLYGGTLGQFVFPLVVIIGFWQQRATVSCAVAGIWFFENFFNVARYLADARAQMLPLVGGGEHDWYMILSRWQVLEYDTTIAAGLRIGAWLGIAAVWAWLAWRTFLVHQPPAEMDALK